MKFRTSEQISSSLMRFCSGWLVFRNSHAAIWLEPLQNQVGGCAEVRPLSWFQLLFWAAKQFERVADYSLHTDSERRPALLKPRTPLNQFIPNNGAHSFNSRFASAAPVIYGGLESSRVRHACKEDAAEPRLRL